MPRGGLNGDDVVAAAAGLADEIGFHAVTTGLLADRLGIRPPSLYKHVGGLADLQHRIATLAMTEFGGHRPERQPARLAIRHTGTLSSAGTMIVASFGHYLPLSGHDLENGSALAVPENRVRDVGLLQAAYLVPGQPELAGGQGVGDMPEPGGADDGRGYAGTAEQPGQRDLGRGRAALRGDLSQPVYHVEVGVGVVPLVG